MTKLRSMFWKRSKSLVAWCTDEELRVLRIQAANETEKRLEGIKNKFESKLPNVKAKRLRD